MHRCSNAAGTFTTGCYALVGPFVALGLASAWRRGDGRAARRCLTLGVVAVLFGSVVLGTNVAREHAALGGETPLAELPSVQSALYRTSVVSRGGAFDWPGFAEQQFSRIGLASVPYAVSRFVVDVGETPVAARYGTPNLAAVSALLVLATLVLFVVRPAARYRLPLAALALSGPCWAVAVRGNVSQNAHEFEGMFYVGVPLALFALTPPRLDRLLRAGGRVTVLAGTAAAATFVLSCLLMARAVHDPERAQRERTRAADSDAIRGLAEGKTIANAAVVSMSRGPHYYFRGAVQTALDKRHLADFVLGDRLAGVRPLTSNNRSWFLYDRSVYEAALTRYERRADEQHPVLLSPDYDVLFIRNEEGGDELLYVRRECPAAVRFWPGFFLHVHPVDMNDLRADRRRHGFENHDFSRQHFWRRAGSNKCYAVRPLPDYGIAIIHTGQFKRSRTREGRYENVWAGSFSPGDHDDAGGGAPPH